MQKSTVRRFGALAVGLALVASACGSDTKSSTATTTGGGGGTVKCSGIKLAFIGALLAQARLS